MLVIQQTPSPVFLPENSPTNNEFDWPVSVLFPGSFKGGPCTTVVIFCKFIVPLLWHLCGSEVSLLINPLWIKNFCKFPNVTTFSDKKVIINQTINSMHVLFVILGVRDTWVRENKDKANTMAGWGWDSKQPKHLSHRTKFSHKETWIPTVSSLSWALI